MRFNFTGKLAFNGEETKNPWYRSGKTKKGASYHSVNMSVIADDNNRGYTELFGMVQDVIKTLNLDNEKVDVDWNNRLNEDEISNVAIYRRNAVSVNGNRHEFIAPYDMVEYIREHKDEFADGKFVVTGDVVKNIYNGSVSNRFQLRNIYSAKEDAKNKLKVDAEIFFAADDVDTSDWGTEKKIYFNAYTREYIDGSNKYVPQQFIFDFSKFNLDNPDHLKRAKFNLMLCNLSLEGNKIKNNLKKKKIYSLMVNCLYINGAEEIPFDENQLTDVQKMAIELGFNTIDDFKPKGRIFGQRVQLFKICGIDVTSDTYADGIVETDILPVEFEDEILVVTEQESEEVVEEAAEEEGVPFDESDDDDLFG